MPDNPEHLVELDRFLSGGSMRERPFLAVWSPAPQCRYHIAGLRNDKSTTKCGYPSRIGWRRARDNARQFTGGRGVGRICGPASASRRLWCSGVGECLIALHLHAGAV